VPICDGAYANSVKAWKDLSVGLASETAEGSCFETPDGVDEVQAFYKADVREHGWTGVENAENVHDFSSVRWQKIGAEPVAIVSISTDPVGDVPVMIVRADQPKNQDWERTQSGGKDVPGVWRTPARPVPGLTCRRGRAALCSLRSERGEIPIGERIIIVRTDGRYIGQMPAAEYVDLTDAMRARTEVLAVCPSRAKARWIFKQLPHEWPRDYSSVPQDKDNH